MCCCQEKSISRATWSKRGRIESRMTAFLDVGGSDALKSAKKLPSDDSELIFGPGIHLIRVDSKPHRHANDKPKPLCAIMAKFFLDCLPLLFSMISINWTHASILKECFSAMLLNQCSADKETSPLSSSNGYAATLCAVLCQTIYVLDVGRNFLDNNNVPRQSSSKFSRIWQYMFTWFVVDTIYIMPWEQLIVQPVFDLHRKKHVFFKAVSFLRACPAIRKRWRYIIKARRIAIALGYQQPLKHVHHVPKYLLFFKRMKLILLIRVIQNARRVRRLLSDLKRNIFT